MKNKNLFVICLLLTICLTFLIIYSIKLFAFTFLDETKEGINKIEETIALSSNIAEVSTFSALQSAVTNNEIDNIQLINNITWDSQIVIPNNRSLKIEFQGRTIEANPNILDDYAIVNNGTLRLADASMVNMSIDNENSLIIDMLNMEYNVNNKSAVIWNSGYFDVLNSSINVNYVGTAYDLYGVSAIYNTENGQITFNFASIGSTNKRNYPIISKGIISGNNVTINHYRGGIAIEGGKYNVNSTSIVNYGKHYSLWITNDSNENVEVNITGDNNQFLPPLKVDSKKEDSISLKIYGGSYAYDNIGIIPYIADGYEYKILNMNGTKIIRVIRKQ